MHFLWTIFLPLLAVPWAEEPPQSPPVEASRPADGFFFGLHGTGHVPYGAWTDHFYAGETIGGISHPTDLKQVGPGGGGMFELGTSTDIHDFSLQFAFNFLSSKDWEDYAGAQGTSLSVSLYKWDLSVLWGVEFVRFSSFSLQARFGIGYTLVTGSEKNHDYGVKYSYDFYQHSFSARAGIGACLNLSRGLVLFLAVDQVVGVPGVSYPQEGRDRPYLGLAFSLGLRFWPVVMWK